MRRVGGAGSVPDSVTISWRPTTPAKHAALVSLLWHRAPATIRIGVDGGGDGAFQTVLTGLATTVQAQNGAISITITDLAADLTRPVIDARFAGSGGAEGGSSLKDQPKRRYWGRCLNVQCLLFDKANNLWVIGDPARSLQAIDAVKDKGNAAAPLTTVAWAGSIAATIAALAGMVLANGAAAVAPSISMVKWWHPSPSIITADIRGEVGGGYVDTVAGIAQALVGARTGVGFDAASIAALATACAEECGHPCADPGETVGQALDRLLGGIGYWWRMNGAAQFEVGPWSWGSAVDSIVIQDAERTTIYPPHKTRRLGYGRNNYKHSASEVAAVLTDAIDFANVTGATKPENNATAGATAGIDIKDQSGIITPAEDVLNRFLSLGFDGTTLNLLRDASGGGGPVSISSLVMTALNSVAASQLLPDLRRPIEDTFAASILAMGEADAQAFSQGKSNTIVFGSLTAAKDETTAAVTKIEGIASRVSTNEAAITTLQSTSASLSGSVATLTTSVSAQAGTIASQGSAIGTLTTGLAAANVTISANSSAIGTLTTTVSGISSTVSAHGTSIDGLSSGLSAANSTLTAHTSSIDSMTTSVSSISSTVASHATSISGLNSFSASASATLSSHASSIGTLSASYTVRLNVNGRVSGFGLASGSGGTSEFAILADRFLVIDPADDGTYAYPFEIVDGVVKMKNALIGTLVAANIAAGIITYDKLVPNTLTADTFAHGATGKKALDYNENAVSFSSTTSWTDVHSISLTPAEGFPIEGFFTLSTYSSSDTRAIFQVVRDDGSVVMGGNGGFREHIDSNGTTLHVDFTDVVDAGRATTWTIQGKKVGTSVIVVCDNRYGRAEENPRATYQTYSVTLASGSGGVGPGGGGGGGGSIP